jgi:hypothetical protein
VSSSVITWAVLAVIVIVAFPALRRCWRMKAYLGIFVILLVGYVCLLVIDSYALTMLGHGG